MKTLIRYLLLIILVISFSANVFAYDFYRGGIYYAINSDGTTVSVTRESNYSSSYSGDVTIPSTVTINGTTYSVTSIGGSAFRYCTGLTSITIPNSVTSIGFDAFRNCTGLTSITIPNSVTSISYSAFQNCTGLTSVTIGDNVTSIGSDAFRNCTGLTSITIPNSVTSISYSAFNGCRYLTSITIGNSVTSIGDSAFSGCNNIMILNWDAKNCTTYNFAFSRKTSITTVTIGDSVETLPRSFLSNCTGVTSITIPNSVTSIGSSAFSDCNNITTLNWNAKNCTTYNSAFANKSSITSVTIGDSVEVIPNSFLSGCTGLTSITIPNSVTSIGDFAFYNCPLFSVGELDLSNVTSIGVGAFAIIRGVTGGISSLTLSSSLTTIPKDAFRGRGLASVSIPNSVTSIGNNAFYNCDNIINISTNAEYIGDSAFANCDRLVNVNLSNNAKVIGKRAFTNCFRLQNISLGNNLDTIGKNAFDGCIRLNKPMLSDSLLYIGDSAFRRCLLFDSTLIIPSKVNYIGNYAFDSCSLITELRMKSEAPPTIFNNTFRTISTNIPVRVPCGKVIDYYTTNYWENFPNILEDTPFLIEVFSDNETMGSVEVVQQPVCNNYQTIIRANANDSYHFVRWSDGNENNPRVFYADRDSSFTAIFMQNTAYLTIHSSDSTMGNVSGTGLYAYRQNVTISATPNTNYHFLQWSDGNTDNPRIILATQDSVFTALFASNISNISVLNNNADMGTVNGSGVYYYQNQIVISATANYGYHFTSWNDGNTDNPRMITVDKDSVFRANFAVNIYSLSVNSSNATMGYTEGTGNYNYLSQVGISATNNYGYHFTQWSDGNTNNPRTITIERDSVFIAQFVANTYTITTEANDNVMGSAYGGGSYSYNTQKVISAAANYGYHFVAWSDGSTENPRTVTITSNANYTAMFEINTYNIITNSSNPAIGTASGGGTYEYNTPINIYANANYGYHFTQWSDGNTDNPRLVTVIQNATYTAQFGINSYSVNVESNNQTKGSVTGNGSYIYNTPATISAMANYGYHFTQWNDGNTENPRTVIITQNMSFTAQFDNNYYTITTNSNNNALGNVYGGGSYEYNSITSLTAQANNHYHFLRWNDNITDNPRTINVLQDSIFTAFFEIDTHNVSLLSANETMGLVTGQGSFDYGSLQTINATANYGYHFVSWSDGSTQNPRNILLTQDTILTAYFVENNYNVSLYVNDTNRGRVAGSGEYTYRSQAILTATEKYGYHFSSWNDGNTENPRNIFVERDTNLIAIFEYNIYTLNVNTNNNFGTVSGTGEYNYLTNVTLMAIPDEHYHFVAWNDGVTQNPRNITIVQDTSFTAIFEIDTHNVVVGVNDETLGEVIGGGTFDYGSSTSLQASGIMGYHFSQWADGNTENPRTVIITQDTNFVAIFEIDTFFVSVMANDETMGTTLGNGIYDWNTEITISATPEEHYHFVSWSDGNTSNPRIVVIDKDTTFVALFEEDDKYSLQIVSSNNTMGTVEGSGVYYAGETVRIKAIANEHYHFSQWSDGSTDNPRWITVISDNTFVANFAKDTYLVSVESENLAMGTVSGSGEFEYGDNIVISANASEGYKFLQWNDGNTDNPRQIRVENDSTFIANFTVDDGVGLQDKEKDDISISFYPNPTSENSLLSVKGLNEDATVVVTDVQGKVIASSKLMKGHQTMEIESARLASGIYYVRVQNANSVRTEKLIKE
ncbi:MAG: leucine-rich repeat protein [Synergistales bacterium]|nr:leucine-rich repeat protein [Bacteroidales bacterium]MDY6403644.1 leucine-rich repeat protein [Bacteroidales bacterium]MDY6424674.1 leucine-rich repeat protein [Bacteroidales bacterium]MDY6434899.1 leucine-rich repeat protein [Synergistales bacterium]